MLLLTSLQMERFVLMTISLGEMTCLQYLVCSGSIEERCIVSTMENKVQDVLNTSTDCQL